MVTLPLKTVMVVTIVTGTTAVVPARRPGVSVAKTPSLHYSQAYSAVVPQMGYPVGLLSATLTTLTAYPLAVPCQCWQPNPSFPFLPLSRTLHSFHRVMVMAHHNLGKGLHYRASLCCRNYRASLFIHLSFHYCHSSTNPFPGQILPCHIGQNGYAHCI